MKRIATILIVFTVLVIQLSCSQIDSLMTKRNIRNTLGEYCERLKESEKFLSEENQAHFKDSVHLYMKNCKEYNFYDGRFEPLICYPIIANEKHNEALIPILKRADDLKGERVEYIHYVSGKFENGKWHFKIRKGHSESFSYISNYPTLPDSEIGRRVVRNLLLYQYIKEGKTTGEEIFKSPLYMFKDFSPVLDSNEIPKKVIDSISQKRKEIVDVYCKKLKESNHFLSAKRQNHFEDSVLSYVKNHSLFNGKIERLEPIVCYPILLDEGNKKPLVSIIKRHTSSLGEKIDEVYFVSAKFEYGKWQFQLNDSPFIIFNYDKNEPSLSDTEIGIKIIEKMELRIIKE